VLGPTCSLCMGFIQVNQFGLVPKGHVTDQWRLIVDLSFPKGNSNNDGINPKLCGLEYTSVADGLPWVLVTHDDVPGDP